MKHLCLLSILVLGAAKPLVCPVTLKPADSFNFGFGGVRLFLEITWYNEFNIILFCNLFACGLKV